VGTRKESSLKEEAGKKEGRGKHTMNGDKGHFFHRKSTKRRKKEKKRREGINTNSKKKKRGSIPQTWRTGQIGRSRAKVRTGGIGSRYSRDLMREITYQLKREKKKKKEKKSIRGHS